jgi:aminoglycoside phosphotransferase (APT) family kinase protein
MTNANIGQLLNQRFGCPACSASGGWRAGARAMVRHGSTIQMFRCRHCGEEVVVKVPRTVRGFEPGDQQAQKEYRVLRELQTAFPQDDQFGTLVPLGYLELDGSGAIITQKFDGVDMVRYASSLDSGQTRGLFRPAGLLLRKLHDSCPSGSQLQSLGVEDKLDYLAQTYGVELRGDAAMRAVYGKFEEEAARLSALSLRATWGHGDFKPENILCDGHKYIILDTQLGYYGAFVYDLASFLNHLLIASHRSRRPALRHRYDQAREEFLAGYGAINDYEQAALRWSQLYFMLCSWGRYRRRSRLSAIFANWSIRPLAQKLAALI